MGGGFWRDLGALGRSVWMAGPVKKVRGRAAEYVAVYGDIVAPIVDSALNDPGLREHVGRSLCAAGTKISFLIKAYATMAGVPFRADLAVLGGAVARLYDDLIDEYGSEDLAGRLSALFDGGPFSPRNDVERLLSELYREVERRLDRGRDDPIFTAMTAVHEYQTRSRGQSDPEISPVTLMEITEAKGGSAIVVLFALMRPAMSDCEVTLIREVGGVLQLLDDYQDVVLDRQAGIETAAVRGEVTLSDICRRFRVMKRPLAEHYGRIRPFFAVLYAILWIAFLRLHWPGLGVGRLPASTPFGVLMRPGDNLIQRAGERRRRD
ncbi:class 1 isoprenoid biosynthesis enzyme [Amycolatopsis sp. NPDC089917]|uniref:class 1 isoprenoid biosynthesis enzyme n=1 Tax=Amycolatopsis sp. NPDC089917 TaxID=3155187 RepID=UPI00341943E8